MTITPITAAAPAITPLPKPAWASAISTADKLGLPQSIFLYGVPGTRKTSIAASIIKVPEFTKVLFIDIDNGTSVLSNDPAFASIDVLKIDSLAPNAFDKLNSVIDDVTQNDYGYDAVILDTLSVAQDVAEKHFKAKFATAGKGGKQDGFAIWGEIGVWSEDTVRKFQNTPYFTGIVTCHSSEKRSEAGVLEIKPKLSGSSKDSIGAIPDLVAYLSYAVHPETGEQHLAATTGTTEGLISKSRWNIPSVIIDFDLPSVYSLIQGKIATNAAAAA